MAFQSCLPCPAVLSDPRSLQQYVLCDYLPESFPSSSGGNKFLPEDQGPGQQKHQQQHRSDPQTWCEKAEGRDAEGSSTFSGGKSRTAPQGLSSAQLRDSQETLGGSRGGGKDLEESDNMWKGAEASEPGPGMCGKYRLGVSKKSDLFTHQKYHGSADREVKTVKHHTTTQGTERVYSCKQENSIHQPCGILHFREAKQTTITHSFIQQFFMEHQ
ncbi:zinc finger protein 169 [Dasypus novemcinctus]|uniref:zinc finger protein 169 n=1 Tax=Dasypus novemcinctus TaxID=9361 RepID=UPI00265E22D2|nr:zinc finger protein 169 [Dasypus novemcinctus]